MIANTLPGAWYHIPGTWYYIAGDGGDAVQQCFRSSTSCGGSAMIQQLHLESELIDSAR